MGTNVVLMSCKQYKIIALLKEYLLISIRTGKEIHTHFFFPPETGLMKKISLVLWQWLMSINLCMSMLFAEHTVRTGVLCGIICVLVIKIALIWGELSTLPFPSLQQLPRLFSAFFFSSPFSKGFYFFFTASRNFHYIVPPLHSCCPKRACHQWICAHIHHGEKQFAGLSPLSALPRTNQFKVSVVPQMRAVGRRGPEGVQWYSQAPSLSTTGSASSVWVQGTCRCLCPPRHGWRSCILTSHF